MRGALLALVVTGLLLACSRPGTATPGAEPANAASPALPSASATPETPATATPAIPSGAAMRFEVLGQTGGEIGCVATQDHTVYLGIGPRLVALDVTDPAQPRLLGEMMPGTARITLLAVAGAYACVADVEGRVHVVAIGDAARLQRVASFAAPSPLHELALAGGRLYLASYAGVYIYDLRDPTHPPQVAFYDTPGQAERLLVSDGLAFVTVGAYSGYPFRGLHIVSVAEPGAPREVAVYGREPGDGGWSTVAAGLKGHYAYVTAGGGELRVLDVADPAHPVEVGTYPTGGQAFPLAATETRLTLAVDDGVLLFDVSDAARPRQVARLRLPSAGWLAAAAGDLAYTVERRPAGHEVGSGSYLSMLHIVDLAGARGPTETGRFDAVSPMGWSSNAQARQLVALGSRLYAAADAAGLRILDVADVARPRLAGVSAASGFFYDVAVTPADPATGRSYALVADGSLAQAEQPGLRLFDVTDPAKVASVGFYDSPGNAMGVAVAGHYAYLADGARGLRVVDIADPAQPVEVGACEWPGFAQRVALAGHYACVADAAEGLRIVDVADPAHPSEVAAFDDGDHATGIAMAGDVAYLATATGVRIVGLADAAQPVELARIPLPSPLKLAVSGTLLCVASDQTLRAYDVTDPAHPQEVASLALRDDRIEAVAVAGAEVYLAANRCGLWTLRLAGTS